MRLFRAICFLILLLTWGESNAQKFKLPWTQSVKRTPSPSPTPPRKPELLPGRTTPSTLNSGLDGLREPEKNSDNLTSEIKEIYLKKSRGEPLTLQEEVKLVLTENGIKESSIPAEPEKPIVTKKYLVFSTDIVTVQRKLNASGHKVVIDGLYGNDTKSALAALYGQPVSISDKNGKKLVEKLLAFESRDPSKIIIEEYSHISPIMRNELKDPVAHKLYIKKGSIPAISDFLLVEELLAKFISKFEDTNDPQLQHKLFVSAVKGKSSNYTALFSIKNGKITGHLYPVKTSIEFFRILDNQFASYKARGGKNVYIFADYLLGVESAINRLAAMNDLLLISRNTTIGRSFNRTETMINRLKEKKLDKATLTFLNGTPANAEEIAVQKLSYTNPKVWQSLKKAIDEKINKGSSRIISTKEELMTELMSGDNDVLLIAAHSDKKYIYFGKERVSLEELKALPLREDRLKQRIGILLSCNTGQVFDNQLQSFSEVLIEKNLFDVILSPSGIINGKEILKMLETLDTYNVLDLRKHWNIQLTKSEIEIIGKILLQHEEFLN